MHRFLSFCDFHDLLLYIIRAIVSCRDAGSGATATSGDNHASRHCVGDGQFEMLRAFEAS